MPELTEVMAVVNSMGLHARPAAKLVQTVLQFESDVQINVNGQRVNAKSIMGLLTLAAAQGTRMTVTAQGPDADQAMLAVRELIASGFGES
ncbi:MAG TPA: HPr family phosphocarrier protein [Candidatus Hydrogenedentes bacterium]|jgi:phosphocarrier protein|nr:HPr family phosphocarrier protein [FCB group bacterium]HQK75499.1 HPr family phosphocarrier protein [Candidatus Hydrogenedentota bacterium]